MLRFERILQVFDDILQQDPLYEVVSTSHGYTLLSWEPNREDWYSVLLLDTPEAMLDALIDAYSSYVEEKVTNGDRDLTEQEQQELDAQCKALREKCLQDK